MKQLLVSKNMNMDSNESVNGTETMKIKLKQIEEKKGTKNASGIRFSIFGEL